MGLLFFKRQESYQKGTFMKIGRFTRVVILSSVLVSLGLSAPVVQAQETAPPVLATGAVADLCIPKGCDIKQFENIGLRTVHYRHNPTLRSWNTSKCDNFSNIPSYLYVWYSQDGINYNQSQGESQLYACEAYYSLDPFENQN